MSKVIFIFILMITSFSFAQQATVSNVLNLRTAKHSGVILQKNKLVGYYVFYLKEKVDKKNNAYEVELFDDNYNPTGTFEIIRPKNAVLVEMVYNEEVFMMHFYDRKAGYEFVTYDREGNQVGSSSVNKDDISKYDISRIENNFATATENVTIIPNGKSGFVRSTYTKEKKIGYEVVAYDNNANEVWSYNSNAESDLIEVADFNDNTAGIISLTVTKKKNLMTKEMRIFCLLLNATNGSLIKEFELGSEEEGQRTLLKSYVNEQKKTITIVGEFYKPKDDILKNKSEGLYLTELSLTGEVLEDRIFNWKGDIDQFAQSLDEDGKKDRPFYVFFHDVIIAKNGHTFMIGEQFIKQVSAGGVALKMIAGSNTNASMFEILIANMVVIELNEKKELVDFKIVPKKNTSIILPQGMGLVSTSVLGYYLKSLGSFDYSFTSNNVEKDVYDVVYIDANRKESKDSKTKSDLMVGLLTIKGGKLIENRIPINCESKSWWIQPGKPGFISVSEYYRKDKKIEMRLEQLSY